MTFIYMDESGDMGFKNNKRSSNFFVVTFLFVNNRKPIEKVIKHVHSGLRKKIKRRIPVLHASKETCQTRQKLLKKISEKECDVMYIYLDKSKVYTELQNKQAFLYNYIVNILLDRIFTKRLINVNDTLYFIASRRETNKFLNENFKSYLSKQVLLKHGINLKVEIKTPHTDKLLQAVDFISWAIFRKLELKDDSYYQLIKNIVKEGNRLFK